MRVVLLFVAVLVMGVATANPQTEHVPLDQTMCADCHGAGLWDPPMTSPTATGVRFEPDGDNWIMHLDVRNDWLDVVEVGAFARTLGHIQFPEVAPGPVVTQTGTVGPSASRSISVTNIAVPDEFMVEIRFSHSGPTNTGMSLEIRPSGTERDWISVAPGVILSPQDLAAAGAGTWDARLATDGPQAGTDWQIVMSPMARPESVALGRSERIGPGETKSISWSVTTVDQTVETRLVFDLYTTSRYAHEPGVDVDEAYLYDLADFAVELDSGHPAGTRDLRQPLGEDAQGLGLLSTLGLIGLLSVVRRAAIGPELGVFPT